MTLDDFHYELPERLIALEPSAERSASRLLHLPAAGAPVDLRFRQLRGLLRPGDLLVLNDTRVMPARLAGSKVSGGAVEVLIERIESPARALAHVRASRAPRAGTDLLIAGRRLRVSARRDDLFELELTDADGDWRALLAEQGEMPLPPYIRRAPSAADRHRYQTVYARHDGAVAAPTAGLHFDEALLQALAADGVAQASITLHVGAGTFQTLRDPDFSRHRMHAEWLQVDASVCAAVAAARARGGRVVAVGTTVVRALESAAADGSLQPLCGDSRLFITPGFRFRVVDAMVSNFHLPRTTLMLLVCAFAGRERVLAAYRHAVATEYRFFSYGDAMFLERAGGLATVAGA